MATFKTRIEDIVGAVGDDAFLSDALTDACAEVINYLPGEGLALLSSASSAIADVNSHALDTYKVVSVQRENGIVNDYVECRMIPAVYEHKVTDDKSMFFATKTTPVYIQREGKIFIHPAPNASPNRGRVFSVAVPTVAHGDSDIADFPDEMVYIVVLGASIKAIQRIIADDLGVDEDLELAQSRKDIYNWLTGEYTRALQAFAPARPPARE